MIDTITNSTDIIKKKDYELFFFPSSHKLKLVHTHTVPCSLTLHQKKSLFQSSSINVPILLSNWNLLFPKNCPAFFLTGGLQTKKPLFTAFQLNTTFFQCTPFPKMFQIWNSMPLFYITYHHSLQWWLIFTVTASISDSHHSWLQQPCSLYHHL